MKMTLRIFPDLVTFYQAAWRTISKDSKSSVTPLLEPQISQYKISL